jgi:hypothetical protein
VVFGVEVPDPREWHGWPGAFLIVLHGLGILYMLGFVAYYVRLHRLQAAAASGDPEDVRRFNRALHGFPNSFYAKQFGMHPR